MQVVRNRGKSRKGGETYKSRLLIEWSQVRVLLGEPFYIVDIAGIYETHLKARPLIFLVGGTPGAKALLSICEAKWKDDVAS